jgi:hypothetical protein
LLKQPYKQELAKLAYRGDLFKLFEILGNRLGQDEELLKKFLRVAKLHSQRARSSRIPAGSERMRVSHAPGSTRIFTRAATARRRDPSTVSSAPAFLMKASAIQ